MKCLFIVQGEGRGHMTQALALRALLERAGHTVAAVVVGQSAQRRVPDYFVEKIGAPVHYVRSPSFVSDAARRGVRLGPTLWKSAGALRRLSSRLDAIEAHLARTRPDVVVNFFEPLAGLCYGLRSPDPPMVCVAHQYMFLHPSYRFPRGRRLHRQAARWFARLTAWGAATRLALSLYPVAPRAEADPVVMPPLLRPACFSLRGGEARPFVLVYLLNRGYAEAVMRWHARRPGVPLHCFVDRPGAPAAEPVDPTLTFHRIDDEEFLSMMAKCRGLVCTAGFESVAEAMYLGKPVQVVPVEGHFEQRCNAHDTERAGAGCRSSRFDLDRLLRLIPNYRPPGLAFRQWVASGQTRFVRAIEGAAGVRRAHPAQEAAAPRPAAIR